MKPHLILPIAFAVAFAGCNPTKQTDVQDLERKNAELQARLAEQERTAKAKEAEDLLAKQAAANDAAARSLAEERAKLEGEKAQLSDAQKKAAAEEIRRKEDAIKASENQIAEARAMAAAKQAAALKAESAGGLRTAQKPPGGTRTLDYFFDALDPFGDWVEAEGYGYVFQPTAATKPGWWPYTDGSWVRTDQGWAWKSNEPFGWATYHYGRWIRLGRRGWVWTPGSEWAPAWVAWRRSDEHIGWAPLPPEAHSPEGFNAAVDEYYDLGAGSYVFVERQDFLGHNSYAGHLANPAMNVRILPHTVNITNLAYRRVKQETVLFNEGPDPASLRVAGVPPPPPVQIRRVEHNDPVPAAPVDGVLSLLGPVLEHIASQSKPKSVKGREPLNINRGWAGIDAEAQRLIRERNAAEARRIEAMQRGAVPPIPPGGAPQFPPPGAPPFPPQRPPKVAPPAAPQIAPPSAQPTAPQTPPPSARPTAPPITAPVTQPIGQPAAAPVPPPRTAPVAPRAAAPVPPAVPPNVAPGITPPTRPPGAGQLFPRGGPVPPGGPAPGQPSPDAFVPTGRPPFDPNGPRPKRPGE